MIPKTRYGHRTDAKRSDGGMAPDGTVPRTTPFGQRISGLAADGQKLHAPVSDENEVITDVTRRVIADERRMTRTSDIRITSYGPLFSPAALLDELPLSEAATATVEQSRAEVRAVLDGSDHRRQPVVAASIAEQVAAGEHGLTGVMLESFLAEGKQEPGPPATLTYGQSVTDACLDFAATAAVLDGLAAAVRSRRGFLCRTGRARAPSPHRGQPGEGLVGPLLRHLEQPEFVHA